jgi:Asp-tRNA(Asn)/Glu-tRNA(Gln) amidotransferase A subunit family amidase
MRAYDALTARRAPASGWTRAGEVSAPLRVGVLTDLLSESESSVSAACELTVAALRRDRIEVEEVEFGWRPKGFGVALAWELAQLWGERVDRCPERFTDLIRSTIEFGRESGEERYRSAMAGIERGRATLRRRLARFDALVCPTVPVPAPDRERETTPESTEFTRVFSALGWPAVSVPAGRDPGGRPIAVQVAGPPSRLGGVIAVARAVEAGAP